MPSNGNSGGDYPFTIFLLSVCFSYFSVYLISFLAFLADGLHFFIIHFLITFFLLYWKKLHNPLLIFICSFDFFTLTWNLKLTIFTHLPKSTRTLEDQFLSSQSQILLFGESSVFYFVLMFHLMNQVLLILFCTNNMCTCMFTSFFANHCFSFLKHIIQKFYLVNILFSGVYQCW